jgi:hypothetical protein
MSVDYFLYVKEKHELLSIYLEEIIHIYDGLITLTKNQRENQDLYNKDDDTRLYTNINTIYREHLRKTNFFIKSLKKLASSVCEHKYVEDLIDITPDKSKCIQYCQFCGFTKENETI